MADVADVADMVDKNSGLRSDIEFLLTKTSDSLCFFDNCMLLLTLSDKAMILALHASTCKMAGDEYDFLLIVLHWNSRSASLNTNFWLRKLESTVFPKTSGVMKVL